jgi:hypothetical protein
MKKIIFLLIISIISVGSYPSAQMMAPRKLVTAPTAGSVAHKSFISETHLFDGGGVLYQIDFGIVDLIDSGLSYGGSNIIGSSKINWQPRPGFQASIRIVEESMVSPGVSIGFDSQGDGPYLSNIKCFQVKSRGVYLVLSRNYDLFGDFGIHGGVNRSLEDGDGDEDLSFWTGFNKTIGRAVEIAGEYDFATNIGESGRMRPDNGYLNAAVKMHFGRLIFELDIKNILRTDKTDPNGGMISSPEPSRELKISYQGTI